MSNEAGNNDVWIYDFARDTPTQFTRHVANDNSPIWTLPDGERILWASSRYGTLNDILSRAADGTGDIVRLTDTPEAMGPISITPDGKTALFWTIGASGLDAGLLPLDTLEPTILFDDDFLYSQTQFSPDGDWIVYGSDEEGQEEIYVRPFPNVQGARVKVSQDGGFAPRWGPNSDEIFYQSFQGADQASGTLMSVHIDTDPTLVPGTPSPLFTGPYRSGGLRSAIPYDVSLDGERFLFIKDLQPGEAAFGQTEVVVIENWLEALKRLAPAN